MARSRRSRQKYRDRHGYDERLRRALRGRRRRLFGINPRCHYCGCQLRWENSTLDHVVPLARGGTHQASNLVLACHRCNQLKGHDGLE